MASPLSATQAASEIPPVRLELEVLHTFPAGAITFGVIFRQFTEAAMLRIKGSPGATELLRKIREEGYFDQGVSIYVNEASTNKNYLRFDCFERQPHYHYHRAHGLKDAGVEIIMETQPINGHADNLTMNGYWYQVPFDTAANGDIRVWALDKLRHRLVEMLDEAGASGLAQSIDPVTCSAAIDALVPYVFAELVVPAVEPDAAGH